MEPITHIHHISAIVGDAQETYDFYTNVLNLSLIKQTVNYDDTKHITYISQMTERNMIWYLLSLIGQINIEVVSVQVRLTFSV